MLCKKYYFQKFFQSHGEVYAMESICDGILFSSKVSVAIIFLNPLVGQKRYTVEHLWTAAFWFYLSQNNFFRHYLEWEAEETGHIVYLQEQPPEVFFKKNGVLKNSTKFTEKHLCWSLLCCSLRAGNFIKKRLHHRYLLVNFAKFLRTSFL